MKIINFTIISLVCLSSFHQNLTQNFYSQFTQDQFILNQFASSTDKKTFVDIGAYDGVTSSNTLALEEAGWRGVCFEPTPYIFKKLKDSRNCICIQGCICDFEGFETFICVKGGDMLNGILKNYDPRHLHNVKELAMKQGFPIEEIEVPCYTFNKILDALGMHHIDALCIDIEGGELRILKSINWDLFDIDIIVVEEIFKDLGTQGFLESKGFVKVAEMYPDMIYRNKKYLQ